MSRGRPYPLKTVLKAMRLYRSGVPTRRIVSSLHVRASTVCLWRKKYKVASQPRGGWTISAAGRRRIGDGHRGVLHWNWKGDLLNRRCSHCDSVFRKSNGRKTPSRGKFFCSRQCSNAHQIEDRHPCWRGGHPTHRGGRYTIWARAVLALHGKRCKKCGSRRKVQAHHIRPWKVFPTLRYDVSNGTPLCNRCHVEVHRRRQYPWLILPENN